MVTNGNDDEESDSDTDEDVVNSHGEEEIVIDAEMIVKGTFLLEHNSCQYPVEKLVCFGVLWIVLTLSTFFKGGKGVESLVGFDCTSPRYGILLGIQFCRPFVLRYILPWYSCARRSKRRASAIPSIPKMSCVISKRHAFILFLALSRELLPEPLELVATWYWAPSPLSWEFIYGFFSHHQHDDCPDIDLCDGIEKHIGISTIAVCHHLLLNLFYRCHCVQIIHWRTHQEDRQTEHTDLVVGD